MAGYFQHKTLWALSNLIQKFAREFDCARYDIKPAELYRPMMYLKDDGSNLMPNKCVVAMLTSEPLVTAKPNWSTTTKAEVVNSLLAAGMPRRWAVFYSSAPSMVVEQLDTLVNRLVDPPSEETGRTVFDALIDALRAIAPAPKKPNAVDKKRHKAFAGGIPIKAIARSDRVSEKAVEKSLTIVRQWNEYHGIASGPKGKRGRTKHSLAGMADAKALRPDELAED